VADYLKIPELARRLDVSEKTARRYVKAGTLPSTFIGGAYRVAEEDLERFLRRAEVKPESAYPKDRAPSSTQPPLNGFEERPEDTEYIHFSTVLDRIGAAGGAAREVVQEWRSESARAMAEVRPPAKYRTMEMRSFHNELSAIYTTSIDTILKAAKEGTISVGRRSDEPQDLADDPSLWPRELREFLYDAGSHIAVLPTVIEGLEREWTARGFEVASFGTQRGATIEDELPNGVSKDAGWKYAIEKARQEAGVR
jgi:excisionase family DNA binding protein